MLALQDVVDVVGGGDVGLAAGERFGDAEEADEVGAIGVEVLSVLMVLVLGVFLWRLGDG